MVSPADDIQFEEHRVTKVEGPQTDGAYVISCDVFSFFVPPHPPITPAVGQIARFYGEGFGRPVRGLTLDGVVVFYRTAAEQQAHALAEQEAWRQKKQNEFKASGRVKLDADYLALPDEFKRRIDRFRTHNPDFRWDMEPYEMSVCVDAVRIARALGSADAVRHFYGLGWDEQQHLVSGLFDGHSGNSFGAACRLAAMFLNRPDLVEKEHGALCPLVGCRQYGCWALDAQKTDGDDDDC